jgi:hypothetical protein
MINRTSALGRGGRVAPASRLQEVQAGGSFPVASQQAYALSITHARHRPAQASLGRLSLR